MGFSYSGFMGILLLHFYKQHISLADFLLADAIACAANVLFITCRRHYNFQRDMRWGFSLLIVALFILAFIPFSRPIYFLYALIQGLGAIIFYVPYNILFFSTRDNTKNYETMVRYWGIIVGVNVFGPLIGSFIFGQFGFRLFLIVAMVVSLISLSLTRFIPKTILNYSVSEAWNHVRPLRLIIFLDGTQTKIPVAIGLFALLYISTTQGYGTYLSVIALVALVGGLFLARKSDRSTKRLRYLVPASLAAGAVALSFVFAKTFFVFMALMLLLKAAAVLVDPMRGAILTDKLPESPLNWISRELYLNAGRAVMLGGAGILLYFNLPTVAFVGMGLLYITFPLVVYWKKVY